MIHLEPELPEPLRGLRSAELCAWLDLAIEHDERMVLVPVDVQAGEVLGDHAAWRAWLRDNPGRVAAAVEGRARSRRLRRLRRRRSRLEAPALDLFA